MYFPQFGMVAGGVYAVMVVYMCIWGVWGREFGARVCAVVRELMLKASKLDIAGNLRMLASLSR